MCFLQVIVELRVVFLKIGEIDTLKEQYSADTFIQAKWREPALDGKTVEVSTKLSLTCPLYNMSQSSSTRYTCTCLVYLVVAVFFNVLSLGQPN